MIRQKLHLRLGWRKPYESRGSRTVLREAGVKLPGLLTRRIIRGLAVAASVGSLMVVGFLLMRWYHFSPRPSGPIIIYLVDALRADRLSVYNAPRDTTPAASELAREGVVFDRAFAMSTWTRPSVATMLTSRLPAEVGAINRNGRLDAQVPYLPVLLKKKSWLTACFHSNGNIFDPQLGFSRGFDRFEAILEPDGGSHAFARNVVDPVIRFIEQQQSGHFFLYVHVVDPHAPIKLESQYKELFGPPLAGASERESLLLNYDRAVRQADDQFGRIVATLRVKGWWDATTAIYTADHGEEFFEHGSMGHGETIYEEQVHIPLIIKYPTGARGGTRRSDPVTLADLTPTLADLCGLATSRDWVGKSLLRSAFAKDRTLYFTEDLDDKRLYGIQKGIKKIIVQLYPSFNRRFFQLDRDPEERRGIVMLCGQQLPLGAEALNNALQHLRNHEVQFFPGACIDGTGNGQATLEVTARIAPKDKPFLRDTDYCNCAGSLKASGLTLRRELHYGEQFLLFLSDDDLGGELPLDLKLVYANGAVTVAPGVSVWPVRLVRTSWRLLKRPTSDELFLKQLRSLGYIK